jgi:hypothetical protein
MTPEADPIDGHRGRSAGEQARTRMGGNRSPRREHRVPLVKELPRRWDPLTEAEVTMREID